MKAVDTVLCRANAPMLGRAARRTRPGRCSRRRRVQRTVPPARTGAAMQHTHKGSEDREGDRTLGGTDGRW